MKYVSQSASTKLSQRVIEACERWKIYAITKSDMLYYPNGMRKPDIPPVLFFKTGRIQNIKRRAVAILGTKFPSPFGYECAQMMAKHLDNKDITVLSGLDIGINRAAHDAALSKGNTAAVLPCGLNMVYPTRHTRLAQNILDKRNGMLMSPFPPGTRPSKQTVAAKASVMVSMPKAVIIAEGAYHGATVNIAKKARKFDNDIYVVWPEGDWGKADRTKYNMKAAEMLVQTYGAIKLTSFDDFKKAIKKL